MLCVEFTLIVNLWLSCMYYIGWQVCKCICYLFKYENSSSLFRIITFKSFVSYVYINFMGSNGKIAIMAICFKLSKFSSTVSLSHEKIC